MTWYNASMFEEEPISNLVFLEVESPNVSADGFVGDISRFLQQIWNWLQIPAVILTLIFLTLAVYAYIRLHQVREEQKKELAALTLAAQEGIEDPVDKRWQRIEALSESPNENDWRQAILNADVMLDEMVVAMGYGGNNLGERMSGIEKSDFTSLDKAWEAHKVRNRIAHEGLDLDLSHREVRRVIGLYKDVFEEFHYI